MLARRLSFITLVMMLAACRGGGSSDGDGDADGDTDVDGDIDVDGDADFDGEDPDGDLDEGGDSGHPDGPVILIFNSDADSLTQGGSISFFAMVTDPNGVEDVTVGRLTTPEGLIYDTFVSDGGGSYSLVSSWAAINRISPIEFIAPEPRTFVATFIDVAGHQTSESLAVELTCGGLRACAGACVDTSASMAHCGDCGNTCRPTDECRAGVCAPPCGDGLCVEGEDGSICPEDCCPNGGLSGDVEIRSAADLDSLRGYRTLSGNLSVDTSDLTNLRGLECLTEIGGALDISNNALLADVQGLQSLTRVGGIFLISSNSRLGGLEHMASLTSAGRGLIVLDNGELQSLDGLESLMSVGPTLRIRQNVSLTSIDAISGIACVEFLTIAENASLPNCEAEALRDRMFTEGCIPAVTISDNSDSPCD